MFLGPRGPLRVPSIPARPSTRPQEKSRSPLQPNKSSQDHCQPIKLYIFRQLMTHTIHRCPGMTKTNTHTKTNTKCSKDPTYVIFLKSRGFKDIKNDNMSVDQTRPDQTILSEFLLPSRGPF